MKKELLLNLHLKVSEKETLKKYADTIKIDFDSVLQDMRKRKKEEMLAKHPYAIFYSEKDQRWKTNLPDENKSNGRRVVARKKKEDLETIITQFYLDLEDAAYLKEHIYEGYTLRDIYPKWLSHKEMLTDAKSYIKRIDNDYKKYYINDEIINIPVQSFTTPQLVDWAHEKVNKYKLTKTSYYNMAIIIRQCLDYAIDRLHILSENPFNGVRIQEKLFLHKPKPEKHSQVFVGNESSKICTYAFKKYTNNPITTTPLAIILNFHLGLRIGELLALKWTDIVGNYIVIRRMQVDKYEIINGEVVRTGLGISEYTKTVAGQERPIYLNSEARNILNLIRETNERLGLYEDDFIFLTGVEKQAVNGTTIRLATGSYNEYLYELCEDLGFIKKSSHKIRKNFLSSLLQTNVSLDKVREIAGHRDTKTLLTNYVFDINEDVFTENEIENINYGIYKSNQE